MSTLKLCYLAAKDAKKRENDAIEDTETGHKTDKKNDVEELATKFHESPYAQRSKQFQDLLQCYE